MNKKIQLQYIDINKLSPFEGNPRNISEKGLDILDKSIGHYGITNPILAWKNPKKRGKYEILAGHQRLKIFQKKKIKHIPIILLNMKDWHEAYSYLLMDNKSQDYSEYDYPILKDLLCEIDDGSIDDIEITGFNEDEIKKLVDWEKSEDEEKERIKEIKKGLKEGIMIVIGWCQMLVRPGMPEFDKLWEFAGTKKRWSEEETQAILKKIHDVI